MTNGFLELYFWSQMSFSKIFYQFPFYYFPPSILFPYPQSTLNILKHTMNTTEGLLKQTQNTFFFRDLNTHNIVGEKSAIKFALTFFFLFFLLFFFALTFKVPRGSWGRNTQSMQIKRRFYPKIPEKPLVIYCIYFLSYFSIWQKNTTPHCNKYLIFSSFL